MQRALRRGTNGLAGQCRIRDFWKSRSRKKCFFFPTRRATSTFFFFRCRSLVATKEENRPLSRTRFSLLSFPCKEEALHFSQFSRRSSRFRALALSPQALLRGRFAIQTGRFLLKQGEKKDCACPGAKMQDGNNPAPQPDNVQGKPGRAPSFDGLDGIAGCVKPVGSGP